MSTDSYKASPVQPMAMAASQTLEAPAAYDARRPPLSEILNNTSPPPWTLAAFMAYLSSNHCLETLEFTMDASRYRKHYAKMMARAQSNSGGMPSIKDREYVQDLWRRLIGAYIKPSGAREVNLPSHVRDPILHIPTTAMPPAPEVLDLAVSTIYELMEESVLTPFLNSVSPPPSVTAMSHQPRTSGVSLHEAVSSDQTKPARRGRHSPKTPSPPLHFFHHHHRHNHGDHGNSQASVQNPARHSPPPATISSPTPLSVTANERLINPTLASDMYLSGSTASIAGSGSLEPGMTDDTGSTGSIEPSSPLASPPPSVPWSASSVLRASGSASPRLERERDRGDHNVWRKLGGRFSGVKVGRKRSDGALGDER